MKRSGERELRGKLIQGEKKKQCWLPKFKPVNHAENIKPILRAFFFKLLSRDSEVLDPESGKVNDDRLPSLICKYTTIILESVEVIISPKYHLFEN